MIHEILNAFDYENKNIIIIGEQMESHIESIRNKNINHIILFNPIKTTAENIIVLKEDYQKILPVIIDNSKKSFILLAQVNNLNCDFFKDLINEYYIDTYLLAVTEDQMKHFKINHNDSNHIICKNQLCLANIG